jgi:hypothetical protein
MVLQQVGQDGFDSYHEMQPWGMDVMKVGKSLGLGSPGVWRKNSALRIEKTDSVSCRIAENGDVYSSIVTQYNGWKTGKEKVNVQSVISIHAGTRLTHQELKLSPAIDSLCTGIVKDKTAKLSKSVGDALHFGYIATYGKQSLNSDELGLAVFFNPHDIVSFTEDADSHVVILNSSRESVQYYYLAAWVGEKNGIKNEADFNKYVSRVAEELANPLTIEVRN